MGKYKTVYRGAIGEITEKKSRFIATVRPVESEEEAVSFLEEIRKKYWDASHNCYAYLIGRNNEWMRCSDDGEPGGTAGKPMLDVLLGEELHNVAVVVTRYFGGTLLGTGGLVRAYSRAVQAGLENSQIAVKEQGVRIFMDIDYNTVGKVQYIIGKNRVRTLNSVYADNVRLEVLVRKEEIENFTEQITEATAARVKIEKGKEVEFADVDGELVLFDE